MNSATETSDPPRPTHDAHAPTPSADEGTARRGLVHIAMELTKARLNALVLVTTAVGYLLATTRDIDAPRFLWTMLGTALAAASAAMLNQLWETRRDALMHRTRERPLPAGLIGRIPVLIAGVLAAYAGVSVLGIFVNLVTAGLAFLNVLVYVLVYTPLKPRTTLNTLVGGVCGAIPPMMGWTAVTGNVGVGAWVLGAILFVWQLPHFFALAWMYREDYRRGGMFMLPVVDPHGEVTARTIVITSVMLAPLGLAVLATGLSGSIAAGINIVLALWMAWLGLRFYFDRSNANARRVFLASIAYLPIALGAMVLDRFRVLEAEDLRVGRTLVIDPAILGPTPPTPPQGPGS
ncbi:MAG: protoheme IX farnesyltransferase [Phycisphaerae bacterium]|nr:protoheme IX farnesyltransferase [Phycisphaerae bacterium]